MLTLITFGPFLGLRSASPFAVKAEALMALSGLEYSLEFGDVRKAPMGKFPVLRDGEKLIADTALIQHYLENEKGVDFNRHLNAEEVAIGTAFMRLVEDHIYFINTLLRWRNHGDAVRDNYFTDVPGLLRNFVFNQVRKSVYKAAHMQGIGRHKNEDMIRFAIEDIDAIANFLADKNYLFGVRPSSFDCSLYGMLHGLMDCPLKTPVRTAALKHENLVDYCARFGKSVFHDGE